jgi:cyd operon protein YbgT
MWYFAWILGVTVAVLLASLSSSMMDAGKTAQDEEKLRQQDKRS